MKIVSKENFMKVWEDTSREQILNQFYYDYKTLREEYNNWNELKEWLKMEHREDAIVINLTWKHATGKILNKINELEGKSE